MCKIMALFAFVLVTFVSGIVSAAETKVAMSNYDEAQIEWYLYYGAYSQDADSMTNVHSTATKKAVNPEKKGSK